MSGGLNSAAPGEYRKIQNYVVNSKTRETIYIPPPVFEVPILMSDLVAWLGAETDVHPVLAAGIAQFQLVHVHPFLDGNGRSARLLSTLCLYRTGYDFKKLFTISEFYDRDRPAYYRALQSVREADLDLTGWEEYFTSGLATQMQEVRERGEKVIRHDLLVRRHGLSDRQGAVVGHFLDHEILTIQDFEALCPGVSRRTLQRELKGLVEAGLFNATGATNKLVYRFSKGKS